MQDDPNDEASSNGSSSNPSQDNLEEEDIYKQVYGLDDYENINEHKNELNSRFI